MSEEEKVSLQIESPSMTDSEIKRNNTWKSCCFVVQKDAIQFFSQLVISLLIITFCLFQLHYLDKCESAEYMSLLTLVLGTWLPQPSMK
jgi:hypothetical protein